MMVSAREQRALKSVLSRFRVTRARPSHDEFGRGALHQEGEQDDAEGGLLQKRPLWEVGPAGQPRTLTYSRSTNGSVRPSGLADIEPIVAPTLPLELQVAEKVHVYTRNYGDSGATSTRVKDLIEVGSRDEGHVWADVRISITARLAYR